jgi:hypothetical protein
MSPTVAFDARGDAFAVWTERAPAGFVTLAAIRRRGEGWTARVPLASGSLARLAVNPRGDAVVVGFSDLRRIFVVFRPAGGRWGRARLIGGKGGFASSVAIDAVGRVAVGWSRDEPSGGSVYVEERSADGSWRSRSFGSGDGISVVMNARGDALAVWHSPPGTDGRILASWKPSGHGWQRPSALPVPRGVHNFPGGSQAGLDVVGNAIVVWSAWLQHPVVDPQTGGLWTGALEVSSAALGTRFGSPQRIGYGRTGVNFQLALNPAGRATIVFLDGRDEGAVWASTRVRTGAAFGAPRMLAAPQSAFSPAAAISPNGTSLAVWTESDSNIDGHLTLAAATAAPGGGFAPPATIASVGGDCFAHRCETGGHGAAALAPDGSGIIAWVEKPNGDASLGGVVRVASFTP